MTIKRLYIRKECAENEERTPLVPNDVVRLIECGIEVFVQSSDSRIYKDEAYAAVGAIITDDPWYTYCDTLIVGIKELDNLEKLNNHTHVYFSHSYKNQTNSKVILDAFKISNSVIYDFEYFTNNQCNRLIGFGYYAGIAAAILGIQQYTNRQKTNPDLANLKAFVNPLEFNTSTEPKIALMGPMGCCGSGVRYILDRNKINYTKNAEIDSLNNFDIVFNCIKLETSYNKVWFDKTTSFTSPIIIVDVSCDYSKPNNPIALYNHATTWQNPVYKFNRLVDIIAIDNLPSLIPKDSSDHFSAKFTNLLLDYDSSTWQRCLNSFTESLLKTVKQ